MVSGNLTRLFISGRRNTLFSIIKYMSNKKDISFSKTPAFGAGSAKGEYASAIPKYVPNYYDSTSYKLKRLLSMLLSVGAVIIYIAFIREPNDVDEMLNSPSALLMSNLQRSIISDKIRKEKESGRSTELLEAELEYVDVKEAELRAKQISDRKNV